MNLTNKQLHQIIKEELENTINEMSLQPDAFSSNLMGPGPDLMKQLINGVSTAKPALQQMQGMAPQQKLDILGKAFSVVSKGRNYDLYELLNNAIGEALSEMSAGEQHRAMNKMQQQYPED